MLLAFLVHDWGYWGMHVIDGPKDRHPVWASLWVERRMGRQWEWVATEMMLHSRFMAEWLGMKPSRLCWADKVGTYLMPHWLWAVLAWLSGEGLMYMDNDKYEINRNAVYTRNIRGLYRFHVNYCRWVEAEVLYKI
jgi:hypothetical protein